MKKKILDIGCGKYKIKGAIGVDNTNLPGIDVKHDLNKTPYPFKQNYFEEIHCYHILEHLDNLMSVMEEIYRIGDNNCMVFIRVPHASCIRSSWSDPTHKRPFTARTFLDYFSKDSSFGYYSNVNFKVIKIKLNYCVYDGTRETRIPRWWQKIWNSLANINFSTIELWERILGGYIGGFEELEVTLQIKK